MRLCNFSLNVYCFIFETYTKTDSLMKLKMAEIVILRLFTHLLAHSYLIFKRLRQEFHKICLKSSKLLLDNMRSCESLLGPKKSWKSFWKLASRRWKIICMAVFFRKHFVSGGCFYPSLNTINSDINWKIFENYLVSKQLADFLS